MLNLDCNFGIITFQFRSIYKHSYQSYVFGPSEESLSGNGAVIFTVLTPPIDLRYLPNYNWNPNRNKLVRKLKRWKYTSHNYRI